MATTNLNICIDDNLIKEAEDLFTELGLSMTTAITMFLSFAVNHKELPFELKKTSNETIAPDDLVTVVSKRIMEDNMKVYKELAK